MRVLDGDYAHVNLPRVARQPLGISASGVKRAESGFLAVGGGAFDEPAGGVAFVAFLAGLLRSLPRPLVFDVTDREPQELHDGLVVGEASRSPWRATSRATVLG